MCVPEIDIAKCCVFYFIVKIKTINATVSKWVSCCILWNTHQIQCSEPLEVVIRVAQNMRLLSFKSVMSQRSKSSQGTKNVDSLLNVFQGRFTR